MCRWYGIGRRNIVVASGVQLTCPQIFPEVHFHLRKLFRRASIVADREALEMF